MKKHAELGYEMLKHSERPLLKAAAIVAYEHHEKYNGTGYPRRIKGEDEKIFALFKEEMGEHFDPKLVDVFFEHLEEFLSIRNSLQDISSCDEE